LIKIDFKGKPINFYQSAEFSKKQKIHSHIILEQAYNQGVLIDNEKKLLLSFIEYIKKNNHNFKSQLYQDLFASFIIKDNFDKTFLEFGATNGVDLSNTYLLEDQLSWSGVLVEPDTQWIDQLKKNRPRSKIISKCIWKNSGEKLTFFSSDSGVLSTIEDFKYSDFESMPDNANERVKAGKNIEVETITLNQLIVEEFNKVSPSYISIDTEGSEYEILNVFNFSKYHPMVLTVEHNFTELENKIDQLMLKNDYIRVFKNMTAFDSWYVSQKLLNSLR
jgi:FkbM family methyltransferase